MASSILSSALPNSDDGRKAREELIATSDDDYESKAVRLCVGLQYEIHGQGRARGRLLDIRKMLFRGRWTNQLFDTTRWVHDLEDAYEQVWKGWVNGEEGDIWL